jgi:protoheme IX farnesyltransferase
LWLASNYVAAALLAFTIFFYVVIYSMWLKRSTPQNIVIGGAAGALPPVVAWAAASGTAPLEAWVLFAVIFLWTPPHFWALALYREGDYARAGVPMMPIIAGEASTKKQIFVYSIILAAFGVAPFVAGMGGLFYLGVSSAFGAGFVMLAWRVLKSPPQSKDAPKQLFAYSILYLFILFAAILAEDLWGFYVQS